MIITPATHRHKGHADTARRVGQRKGHLPRCKTLSKWKSFLDFNPETRVFLLCWPFQASPLYPTAKMSCRKRCKREIFKFAQYLFRLITGTLNTGKTLTGVFAAVLLNLRWFLYLHLSSFVLLLLNVFIIFFFFNKVQIGHIHLAYHQHHAVFTLCIHLQQQSPLEDFQTGVWIYRLLSIIICLTVRAC